MENIRIVESYPGVFHIQEQVKRTQGSITFRGVWPFRRIVEDHNTRKVWITWQSEFGDLMAAKKHVEKQLLIRKNYPKYYNL